MSTHKGLHIQLYFVFCIIRPRLSLSWSFCSVLQIRPVNRISSGCFWQKKKEPWSTAAMMDRRTTRRRRRRGGSGRTSRASSCRSSRPPSSGIATRTWARGRRSQCGQTSRRHECGWGNITTLCISLVGLVDLFGIKYHPSSISG